MFDSAKFRQVLGHFPTGVTVVTASTPDGPTGFAVGSFTSVSLEPPLVLFCPAKSSTTWPDIEAAGAFCVNVLGEDQEGVCRTFASKSDDKFSGVGWRPSVTGAPILNDVLAYIDCRITQVVEAGDHWVVIAEVVDLEVSGKGGPLVFFRGGYGGFTV